MTAFSHAATDDRLPLPHILDLPLEVKADKEGLFEGYASVFDIVDRDGDRVARGAFAESLVARLPPFLWQHSPKEPIGRFDMVKEDHKGLYVRGRLAMQGRGAEAHALLKMGALDGLSIGFIAREARRDTDTGVRTILRADLVEISLVTFPSNSLARVEAVKAAHSAARLTEPPGDIRSFERFLRRAGGFSRSRARAISAIGFVAGNTDHAGPELERLAAEIERRRSIISALA